jgi:hypothetical protein
VKERSRERWGSQERLASYEGDGLSENASQRLEQRERENESFVESGRVVSEHQRLERDLRGIC